MILSAFESDLEPIINCENHGEIKDQYLDSTKAKTLLNWNPIYGLEEGLKKTIIWYKKQLIN